MILPSVNHVPYEVSNIQALDDLWRTTLDEGLDDMVGDYMMSWRTI